MLSEVVEGLNLSFFFQLPLLNKRLAPMDGMLQLHRQYQTQKRVTMLNFSLQILCP